MDTFKNYQPDYLDEGPENSIALSVEMVVMKELARLVQEFVSANKTDEYSCLVLFRTEQVPNAVQQIVALAPKEDIIRAHDKSYTVEELEANGWPCALIKVSLHIGGKG